MNKPIKVLIVDDEWVIRDGLKSFPWESRGCVVAGEAEDGEEGLLLARTLQPDIILSDIKMPGMDGLTFTRKIREINPETEVILLTGYDNFDFARTAIQYGVSSYLLKPTNYEELEHTVDKLCAKCKEREKRKAFYQDIMRKYENAMPLLISKLTSDLLRGKVAGRMELAERLQLFGIHIDKFIVLSAQLESSAKAATLPGWEPELLEFGVFNICEELFSKYCGQVFHDSDMSGFHFILTYPLESSDQDCMTLCLQACAKVQKAIADYIGLNICVGVSDVGADAYKMNRYWGQAREACLQSVFFGGQCIIEHGDISLLEKDNWVIPEGKRETLFNAVSAGDTESVGRFMQLTLAEIAGEPVDIDSVRSTMLDLVIGCLRISEKMHTLNIKTQLQTVYSGIESIYTSETVEFLVKGVQKTILALTRQNGQKSIDYHKQVVDKITAYIGEHYGEDLSLDMMSEMFHMSSPYISRLIKRETSKNFMEILLDVRMKKARELIGSGKYKIHEIAEMVGYHDFSYFIQVFKRAYGVTPNMYKNLI